MRKKKSEITSVYFISYSHSSWYRPVEIKYNYEDAVRYLKKHAGCRMFLVTGEYVARSKQPEIELIVDED